MTQTAESRRDPDSVYRVVRLVAADEHSWEAAAAAGIAQLAKTIPDLRVAKVTRMDSTVRDGITASYRVQLEASYRIDRHRSTVGGATVTVRRVLIVANSTVGGASLNSALSDRLASGPVEFHVLVPAHQPEWTRMAAVADPLSGFAGVDHAYMRDLEISGRADAAVRLATQLQELVALGAKATGEVGSSDPIVAIAAVLARADFDEIIVSTLPARLSAWMGMDLPSRTARRFHIPVTHVESRE